MADIDDFDLIPGPWYSWPWYKKTYKWALYQPRFKARELIRYVVYLVRWHIEYKHYPEDERFAPDRLHPDGDLLVTPKLMKELTIMQSAPKLENYYTIERK